MPEQAGDFQFVGPAYQAPDIYQDASVLINWYVELTQNASSKTPSALLGCPGLVKVASVAGL